MGAKPGKAYIPTTKTETSSAFAQAFASSLPIFFGYVPLGIAYGLLFQELGYPWVFATLTGAIVFAGSAQFMSVGLLAAKAGLTEIFLTTLFLNLRHLFYGFSLFKRYQASWWKKLYLIFALTDETYSVLTSKQLNSASEDQQYCFFVSALNHFYWIAGCTIGALIGSQLNINTAGFDFALVALFVVLTIEQAKKVKRLFPFVIALVAWTVAFQFPDSWKLFLALSICFLLISTPVILRGVRND